LLAPVSLTARRAIGTGEGPGGGVILPALATAPALPLAFYRRSTPEVARDLIGAIVVRERDGLLSAGRIVETEAYGGPEDRASHAARGRASATRGRARLMFGEVGRAYVYLVYGMHNCLNVVAAAEGAAGAILLRAIEPLTGIDGATDGPGKVCRALGVDRALNGASLRSRELRLIAGDGGSIDVATGRRVGVDYAGEWAGRPWRFWIAGNSRVSARQATPGR
jgi:DNA-3-methyladenine glycosylase